MKPMYLPSVENNGSVEGAYADLIVTVTAASQPVPQIWHLFAYKPELTKHLERLTNGVMRGPSPLSAGLREMIAAVTSSRNQTPFCATTHAAATAELVQDAGLVREVIDNVQSSRLSPAEKALLTFVEKVNRESWRVGPEDVATLHGAGWNDEAIYDAITVCALFNFYNRWVSANGVRQMPDEAIRVSGKRIAENGYIRTHESASV